MKLGKSFIQFFILNDNVLFGEVWSREDKLSLKNRSIVTISALIGNSYLKPLTNPKETKVFIANVTFEPGCRNNWHIHHAKSGGGQILICIDGEGWYQEEGKPAQSLKPGDVVTIPANVKHWHGAKKNSWFSHLAVEVPGEDTKNEWCEQVTDEEYHKL